MDAMIPVIGFVVGFISLFINFYLLFQVSRIAKAKSEERKFMQNVFRLDELDYTLSRIIDAYQEDEKNVELWKEIIDQAIEVRGKVHGALSTIAHIYSEDFQEYPVYPTGYYSKGFLTRELSSGKRSIRIVCHRNIRIASYDLLEILASKANRGCQVEIMFLSSDAPSEVLNQIVKKIPHPPDTVLLLREQLLKNQQFIIEFMSRNLNYRGRRNFQCWVYSMYPAFHMTQVDKTIFVMLPNYNSELVKLKGELVRPCIKVSEKTILGNYFVQNYSYLEDNSRLIFPR